jgi:hypothetical protein
VEYVAESEGESTTDAVRRLLDRGFEDWMKGRRKEAVRRISELEIEDVPDPEELGRQLDSTHDLPDLY